MSLNQLITAPSFASPSPAGCTAMLNSRPLAVFDGLNVILALSCDWPKLSILTDAMRRVILRGYDVLCISDGKTRHVVREHQGLTIAKMYESLLADFPTHFRQSPPGYKADPFILAQAQANDALVVTDDTFTQPEYHRYRWRTQLSRFIRVTAIRRQYYLNEDEFEIPANTAESVAELRSPYV